ncbi:hypothetical protein ACHAXN_011174 [Cyclotella atomus]
MSKRGKNSDGEAANNAVAAESNNNDQALSRLLSRLRREHASNFGNDTLKPADVERARYLMEATAGNVGLASWLYWEDYLGGAAAAAGAAAAGSAGRDANEAQEQYDEYMEAIRSANDPAGEGDKKLSGNNNEGRKRKHEDEESEHEEPNSEDDETDEDDERKQPASNSNERNNDWEEAVQRALAESQRLREEAAAAAAQRNNNQAAAAAAAREFDLESSPRRDIQVNNNQLEAPPPPMAGRRRLPLGGGGAHHAPPNPQHEMNLAAFFAEVNRVAAAGGGGGAFAGLQDAAAFQAAAADLHAAAGLPADRMAAHRMNLHHVLNPPGVAAAVGGGGDLLQYLNPLNGAPNQRVSDLLSRLFQGQPLNEEERRDLMAGLGIDNNQEFDYMSWLFRDAAPGLRGNIAARAGGGAAAARGNAAAAAAAAAGAGGDGDDSNNDESDNDDAPEPDNRQEDNVPFDWNEPFVNLGESAPLRRSGRLRAQRNRRSRGRRNHDAAGGVLGRAGGGIGRFHRRAAGRPNDGGAVSDDDDLFVPGPEPVFREIAADKASKIKTGKRKKCDDLNINAKHLHGGDDDDSSVISDASSVDMTEFFHPTDESHAPFDFLWGKTGVESNDESDDEERTVIPKSWLKTGFELSECGNGLAVAVPSDDEWEIVRRSHPQIIRDGPLKSIKGLFPYHCKGVSALLSIVTAMIYSGASIRGNTVTCDADWTPFDDLTLEHRKREFPNRLIEALSALIFIAAQTTSARCAVALARMDKHHAYQKKKHTLTPEDEEEFTLSRLKMARRVHQCRVCSWEPDTANNDLPMFPRGRDPKNIRVHSSLTNIEDIKSYVRSHLRSFTSPGGCALFLETIARCHGTTHFRRLFESESKFDNPSEDANERLVGCQCKATLQYLEKKSKDKSLPDSMPDEHDCIRVELLSLLLTGKVHSNYENWCADNLGIGLLRIDRETSVGPRLLRPVKPIWVCLGDFGYSTLMLDKKDFIGNVDSLDTLGKAFKLAHWDCWGGEQTTIKVIPSIYDRPCQHRSPTVVSDMEEDSKRTVTESIVNRMLREQKRETADPWCSGNIYSSSPTRQSIAPITDKELQSIKFHPEDQQFYPQDYKRWRFNVDGGSEWISFFRLSGHQKLIVEMKLAPRICVLIRTRWPLAAVREIAPADRVPLV